MIRALIYLRLTSLANRVLVSVRRLRQPQYLAGAAAGALYLYYLIFGRFHSTYTALPHSLFSTETRLAGIYAQALLQIGAAAVFALVLWREGVVWKTPPPEAGLRFSEAEIAFLFPAPLSRRRLIHFSLIKSQSLILLSSLFLSVFFSPRAGFARGSLLHAFGWWVILSSLSFHSTAIALVVVRLRQNRPDFPRLRRAALLIIAAVTAGAVGSFYLAARHALAEPDLFAFLLRCLQTPPLRYMLVPFTGIVAPFLAPNFTAFLRTVPLALLILGALYTWIVRLEVPFEDGSIALAEKRSAQRPDRAIAAARNAAAPARALREPFRLTGRGRPETAFLWKNLFAIQSWFNLRFFAATLALIAAMLWTRGSPGQHTLGRGAHLASLALIGSAMLAFYTLLVGPQILRQDIRSDLNHADVLKTYPLAGWQVVLGEMLTPLAILCGLLWLALLIAIWALTQLAPELPWLSLRVRLTLTLCLGATIPPLGILHLLVPNAAALLFPAWFQVTRTRSGGVEVIGQRLIFALGQILAIATALFPAAVTAALILFASQWLIGLAPALFLATAAVLTIILGEVWVGLWWLGERFENLDLSALDI